MKRSNPVLLQAITVTHKGTSLKESRYSLSHQINYKERQVFEPHHAGPHKHVVLILAGLLRAHKVEREAAGCDQRYTRHAKEFRDARHGSCGGKKRWLRDGSFQKRGSGVSK